MPGFEVIGREEAEATTSVFNEGGIFNKIFIHEKVSCKGI